MVWYVNFLAAVSFATNFATFIYTRKTFNIKQSIYYALTLDSALAFMGNLSILIVSLMKMMLKDNLEIPCYILLLSQLLAFLTFPILNFLTAYIRYKTIQSAQLRIPWITNSKQMRIINIAVLACFIYITIIVLLQAITGFKIFPLYTFCMNEPLPKYYVLFFILCFVPQVIVLIITLALDLKATFIIQTIRAEQTMTFAKRTLLEETPMRASIINGCYIFVIIFTFTAVHLIYDLQDIQSKVPLVLAILISISATKSPLIVLWTFRLYQENMNNERNVDREERRQLEIKEAKKRKLEIALKKFNQIIPIEGTRIIFIIIEIKNFKVVSFRKSYKKAK